MTKLSSRILILLAATIIAALMIYQVAYASSPPVVETGQCQTEKTSVTLEGDLKDSGGDEISQQGFLWGTSPQLQDAEKVLIDTEEFKVNISDLQEGTTYYYQAFAVNAKGTDKGEIKSFTVPVNDPPVLTISSPADQTTVTQGEAVTISAAASDDEKVTLMSLAIDGTAKAEVKEGTLTYRWDTTNLKPGKYELTVSATDGQKTSEKVINLEVKAQPPKTVAAPAQTAAAAKPAASNSSSAAASQTVSRGSSSSYSTAWNSAYPKLSKVNGSFGQFRYKDFSGGRIQIDPKWIAQNIVTITLPGLNCKVQVHKDAAPNFIQAFTLIKNGTATVNGKTVSLLSLVKTMNGTFVPRHVMWNPNRGLSNHSWGTAIDINASDHLRYVDPAKEPNDPNVILWQKAFQPAGFSWGNRYSDSMHYEIIR